MALPALLPNEVNIQLRTSSYSVSDKFAVYQFNAHKWQILIHEYNLFLFYKFYNITNNCKAYSVIAIAKNVISFKFIWKGKIK